MYKEDAKEAVPICNRCLNYMLQVTATRGRTGASFRTAVGDFLADAMRIIQNDKAGPLLDDIFVKSLTAGVTQKQLAGVRAQTELEAPATVGALMIKNALIQFSLATEARIIADMTFISHEDVDLLQLTMNAGFAPAEEIAADDMAQSMFQALISLHAALSFHLVDTARPLPRMLRYQFYQSQTSLVMAYRLYSTARRADELRNENKIVHPAFMPMAGKALSN